MLVRGGSGASALSSSRRPARPAARMATAPQALLSGLKLPQLFGGGKGGGKEAQRQAAKEEVPTTAA